MKKHLIAAAVAGLIAAPAIAQVTVYGNVETGILNTDKDGAASTTALASSIVNSSRLGFRGTEDLGGGLKAFFRLEQTVDLATGRLGGQSTTSANMFDRGAEVGLEGSFGAIKVGKFDITNAEGIDNMSQIGNIGLFSSLDIGSDINHAIQYKSPKIGGFHVEIGTALKDGGVNETTSFYVGGQVSKIDLQFGTTTDKTAAGVERTATTMGARYNFGPMAASIVYGTLETDGKGDVAQTIVSASAPLGGGLTVHGMYGNFETDAFGSAKASETDKMAVALSKAFSKRTTGYLGYVSTDVDGTETNQLYLAVNHRF
jgi:predicted porin